MKFFKPNRLVALLFGLFVFHTCRATETFQNPILSGMYPDPDICRVGDDYHIVHSSFEPGNDKNHYETGVTWHDGQRQPAIYHPKA